MPGLRIASWGGAAVLLGCLLVGDVAGQEPFTPFASTARLINSIDFSPDGARMYLALLCAEYPGVTGDSSPETCLFDSVREPEGWSPPALLPFSGTFPDYEPATSPDGSLIVFNSRRPYADGRTPDRNDLWMAKQAGGEWQAPSRISAITTFDQEESYGTLTSDRTLVFLRGLPLSDGSINYDLFSAPFADGSFQTAQRHPVSSERWGEGDPWISPDGSYLIFTRWDESVGWRETVDLYISFLDGSGWSDPEALEELNSQGPDYGVAASPDGQWLYYRSNSRFMRRPLAPLLERYRPSRESDGVPQPTRGDPQ